jgi:exosortase C (VPDSG-CTERM-specific)
MSGSEIPLRSRYSRPAVCLASVVAVALALGRPLADLTQYVAGSDLHSHALLVPLVVGYLLWVRRRQLPTNYDTSVGWAAVAAAFGVAALATAFITRTHVSENDYLALVAFAFVTFVVGFGFLYLGSRWMAAAAFPMAFLVFVVPLPDAAVRWLEHASVVWSSEAAALFFNLTATSLVRHGTVFELPGTVLEVAQECSGIRSSWVLFVTSLLAAEVFLHHRWRRFALVAFVIPLGILRNGFRILVIGLLCIHIGPHMIDSPIHHRGGPIFFALSLIPLFALAWWLRRGEARGPSSAESGVV